MCLGHARHNEGVGTGKGGGEVHEWWGWKDCSRSDCQKPKQKEQQKQREKKEKTTLLSNLHFICNSFLTLKSDNYLLKLHNTFGLQHFLLTWTENVSIKWPTHDLNCPMRCKFEGLSIVSQYRS